MIAEVMNSTSSINLASILADTHFHNFLKKNTKTTRSYISIT